jgi:hypothetical protein
VALPNSRAESTHPRQRNTKASLACLRADSAACSAALLYVLNHKCSKLHKHLTARKKGKAIQLQAWTGPEGSRRMRLPDFKTIGSWKWWGCQHYAPATFTPWKHSWVNPRTLRRQEWLSMKNENDTPGNRTRDLPACSAVPQPTAPPRNSSLMDLMTEGTEFLILTAYWFSTYCLPFSRQSAVCQYRPSFSVQRNRPSQY